MCTGQVILDSPKEFVIDFLQGLTRPYQVVSRVVLTPQTVTLEDLFFSLTEDGDPAATPPVAEPAEVAP